MNFTVDNQKNFQTNSSVHSIETRNKGHFHTDQLPTYPVFIRVHSILVSEYSTIYHVGSQILKIKIQTLK